MKTITIKHHENIDNEIKEIINKHQIEWRENERNKLKSQLNYADAHIDFLISGMQPPVIGFVVEGIPTIENTLANFKKEEGMNNKVLTESEIHEALMNGKISQNVANTLLTYRKEEETMKNTELNKKYRIVEKDGKFYPQVKKWYGWMGFYFYYKSSNNGEYYLSDYTFKLEEAQRAIDNDIYNSNQPNPSKIIHPYKT